MKSQVCHKSVLCFDTLPAFLSHYYDFRKSQNARFSYESWSRSLGGISRSLLKQIAAGVRSVPQPRAEAFIKYFEFAQEEETHFLDLVALSGGETHKKILQRRVSDRVSYHRDLYIVKEVEKFLETPEIPVLATLFTFNDLPKDIGGLSKIMNVDETLLQRWIDVLENLDFIRKDSHGRWQNTKTSFWIPAQLNRDCLTRFHRLSLERAMESVKAATDQKCYEAILVAMSPVEYKEYVRMVHEFRAEVLGRFNVESFTGRSLFQVNFAISPVINISTPEQSANDL